MKTKLLFVVLTLQATSHVGITREFEYEVDIVVSHYGSGQKLANVKVGPVAYFDSSIFGTEPGLTDDQGRAKIRFRSDRDKAKINYRVISGPDGKKWCLKFHGFFPSGSAFLPPHNPSAKPAHVPTLAMEAVPADSMLQAVVEELASGESEIMGVAMATALTLPKMKEGDEGILQFNDPLDGPKTLASLLKTTDSEAEDVVSQWQALIESAPDGQRLDEKSLSSLLEGDLENAAKFAAAADSLPASAKEELLIVPDTGHLVETIYQLNGAAQKIPDDSPNPVVELRLEKIKGLIQPLRPEPSERISTERFDSSTIKEFSTKVREIAAQP